MQRTCSMAVMVFLLTLGVAAISSARQQQPAPVNPATEAQQNSGSQAQEATEALSPEAEDKLLRQVRHELIMLPFYGTFDNLSFRLDGRTVTLLGQVVDPSTKRDAESRVKHIEGVEKVINNIEVLPPSSLDDRLRRAIYRSIYSYGPMFRYGRMPVPPIHIIVRSGRVTLVGVVDSEGDKNVATMRASQVTGVLSVTNDLRVVKPGEEKKEKKEKKK
jgi:BON domain